MFLKAKLPIWVFIAITAIGVAVIILLIQYKSSVLDEIKLQSIENAYWTKTIPQKDTLAGWKTYTNTEYGFEIKIPTDWSSEEFVGQISFFSPEMQAAMSENQTNCANKTGNCHTEYDFSDILFTNSFYAKDAINTSTQTINDIEFLRYEIMGAMMEGINYKTENNDKIYNFEAINSDEDLLRQILSTFKFIDETAEWKIYTNEDYGFEFEHPNNWYVEKTYTFSPGKRGSCGTSLQSITLCDKNDPIVSGPGGSTGRFDCIDIVIEENNDKLSTQEWMEQKNCYYKSLPSGYIKKETLNIDGFSGLVFEVSGMDVLRSVYVAKEKFVYTISIKNSTKHMDVFNQILSTFKFIP